MGWEYWIFGKWCNRLIITWFSFLFLKGGILYCEMPPFAVQLMAFCMVFDGISFYEILHDALN